MSSAPRSDGALVWPAGLELIGADAPIPLVTGETVRGVDLDRAATTPCLEVVKAAVDALLPYYGAPSRGASFKARVTTESYERARAAVARFVGARPSDVVCFVRNTTEACNLLAHLVEGVTDVVCFELEHHADLLPWRRIGATVLPTPGHPAELIEQLSRVIAAPRSRPLLVALTGVSNVTGELLPLDDIAATIATSGDARLFVDAAQLAPHRAIDMAASGIDYLALSGHKLYAPFGAGALIGARDWLERKDPPLLGGGAVVLVTDDDVVFKGAPDRLEAGTPNVVGAVALGTACDALAAVGMAALERLESELTRALDARLAAVPRLTRHTLWKGEADHVGVACFNLEGCHHGHVAAALSCEHGIGVRHGCFCAHLLVRDLLGISAAESRQAAATLRSGGAVELPGAVRASIGIGTTIADLDRLQDALVELTSKGARWRYEQREPGGEFVPTPDPRPNPLLA
ncbi:MAG: aminotransferase class V-fold PLP-dependent enzyme [Actinomycetota bacterium]|nr:aminotransferase class V-fold PLP-dependent enzyme [Actinomycetota bacterium]